MTIDIETKLEPCPFCMADVTRLHITDRWAAGDGANKRRVAYVRYLKCNARGPMARGLSSCKYAIIKTNAGLQAQCSVHVARSKSSEKALAKRKRRADGRFA